MRSFMVSFGLGEWITKPVIPSSPLQLQRELERVGVFPFKYWDFALCSRNPWFPLQVKNMKALGLDNPTLFLAVTVHEYTTKARYRSFVRVLETTANMGILFYHYDLIFLFKDTNYKLTLPFIFPDSSANLRHSKFNRKTFTSETF